MARMTNRAKQAKETKNKIFETGVNLLRERGFDEVNISDIVKEAHISVGTFYHYYDSKIDLFMDIYRIADTLFEDEISERISGKEFEEQVIIFFMAYCDLVLKDGIDLIKKIFIPSNDLFLTEPRGMHQLLLAIVEENCDDIKNKTAEGYRDDLFLLARGVVFDWALRNGTYELKERMEEVIRLIF